MRPIEWPENIAKFCAATTSSPVRTRPGVPGDARSGRASAGRSAAGASAPGAEVTGGVAAKSAVPTAAATRTRRSRMPAAPPPVGWTRLVSTIM